MTDSCQEINQATAVSSDLLDIYLFDELQLQCTERIQQLGVGPDVQQVKRSNRESFANGSHYDRR